MPSSPERLREVIPSALEAQLWKLAGKWVAIAEGRIAAVSDSYRALIAEIEDLGIRGAIVQLVPDETSIHVY